MFATGPAKVRLGWKWMAVANTLAYYDTATILPVKSFIVQAPGKKLWSAFTYTFVSKANLEHGGKWYTIMKQSSLRKESEFIYSQKWIHVKKLDSNKRSSLLVWFVATKKVLLLWRQKKILVVHGGISASPSLCLDDIAKVK